MKSAKYLLGLTAMAFAVSAHAAPFSEGFDDVSTLAGKGWLQLNTSDSPGNPWFQGIGGPGGIMDAHAGGVNSYVAADFLSTNTGGISNWLISPVLTLDAGSVLSFWTRTADAGFHDLLGVYFGDGAGSDPAGFTLLGEIGANGSYPTDWTEFSFALPTVATGRFAFRQFGNFDTADFIGVDSVNVAAAAIPEPSTYALMALGIAGLALARRTRRA